MDTGHVHVDESKEEEMAATESALSDRTSRIDIPANGCDTDLTLIATDEFKLKEGNVVIRTLKLNRVLTLEKLEKKIQGLPTSKHSGFYTTHFGDICYVINDGDQPQRNNTVFHPYCREQSIKPIETGFYKTSDELGQFRWNLNAKELAKNPGCGCRVKQTECRKGICNRAWGTQIIHVAYWSTLRAYHLIEECAKVGDAKIQFARVKWVEGSGIINHEINNGLLLERKLDRQLKDDLDRKRRRQEAEDYRKQRCGNIRTIK